MTCLLTAGTLWLAGAPLVLAFVRAAEEKRETSRARPLTPRQQLLVVAFWPLTGAIVGGGAAWELLREALGRTSSNPGGV